MADKDNFDGLVPPLGPGPDLQPAFWLEPLDPPMISLARTKVDAVCCVAALGIGPLGGATLGVACNLPSPWEAPFDAGAHASWSGRVATV